MIDFVISDGVPLPVPQKLASKRRGRPPGSKNRPKGLGLTCPTNGSHSWDSATLEHETCTRCGESFPCHGECTHVDCMEAKNLPLPEWYMENQENRAIMKAVESAHEATQPWLPSGDEITEVSSPIPLPVDD
jgi:hypothetical protein